MTDGEYPDDEVALAHVLEYSRDHLDWQCKKAAFKQYRVEHSQMRHLPTNPSFDDSLCSALRSSGWRNNSVATAYASVDTK
jgi:hypothetical protein